MISPFPLQYRLNSSVKYPSQKLRLWKRRNETVIIRIFGYEVPLKTGQTRGECIDLIGYDKAQNLYLIELKKKTSSERMSKVIDQVNDYTDAVKKIVTHIEKEFENEYFLPIRFSGIKRIILAPREFYDRTRKKECVDLKIQYAYFRDTDITKRKPGDIINIHLVKR